MKGLIIWLAGLLPGIPIGYVLRMMWTRPPKRQCKFIRESRNESKRPIFTRCSGAEASSCVEHLCPAHCREVHADNCRIQLFADTRVRDH